MAGVLALFMVCAWQQTAYWQNSETLWTHTLACTTDNDVAEVNLGLALMQKGRMTPPSPVSNRRCKSGRTSRKPTTISAMLFCKQGKVDEAIAHCQQALQIKPDDAEACVNLGNAFFQKGEWTRPSLNTKRRCKSSPHWRWLDKNLGAVLMQKSGRPAIP